MIRNSQIALSSNESGALCGDLLFGKSIGFKFTGVAFDNAVKVFIVTIYDTNLTLSGEAWICSADNHQSPCAHSVRYDLVQYL